MKETAIQRAIIDAMLQFAREGRIATLTDLGSAVGRVRSTVCRQLRILADRGHVRKTADRWTLNRASDAVEIVPIYRWRDVRTTFEHAMPLGTVPFSRAVCPGAGRKSRIVAVRVPELKRTQESDLGPVLYPSTIAFVALRPPRPQDHVIAMRDGVIFEGTYLRQRAFSLRWPRKTSNRVVATPATEFISAVFLCALVPPATEDGFGNADD